jgi:hypothetical protein
MNPPLPGTFGLVEAPLARVVEPYAEVVARRLGVKPSALYRSRVSGPLDRALARLEGPSGGRHLLAPTTADWVAYFESALRADPRPVAAELPDRLNCRTLLLYASPSSTVGFALRGPGHAGMLDAIRVVIVSADEREPQTYGDPLPFEDTAPRNLRLGLDWLDRYCHALGLRVFDPGFYFPRASTGVLLSGQPVSPDRSSATPNTS